MLLPDGSSVTRADLSPPIYINWRHVEQVWRVIADGESYAVAPPLLILQPVSLELRNGRGWAVVHEPSTLTDDGGEPATLR